MKDNYDAWIDVVPVDPDAIELALPPATDAAGGLNPLDFQVMRIAEGQTLEVW